MKSITVHYTSSCPYCLKVLNFLNEKGIDYEGVSYDGRSDDFFRLVKSKELESRLAEGN